MVHLLERAYVSQMFLAMEEHSGDGDLRGSAHRSVIPYVHGRISVLYCCELNLYESLERVCLDSVATLSFYSTRKGSYEKTRGPTCGPEVVGTLLQHLGY
jgi:hypothetical protein